MKITESQLRKIVREEILGETLDVTAQNRINEKLFGMKLYLKPAEVRAMEFPVDLQGLTASEMRTSRINKVKELGGRLAYLNSKRSTFWLFENEQSLTAAKLAVRQMVKDDLAAKQQADSFRGPMTSSEREAIGMEKYFKHVENDSVYSTKKKNRFGSFK